MVRRGFAIPAIVIILASCSGGSSSDGTPLETADPYAPGADQPLTDETPSSTGETIRADVVADAESLVFSWEPIAGADSYGVVVVDTDDVPVWIWTGRARTAAFGSFPEEPAIDDPDPELLEQFGSPEDLALSAQGREIPVPGGGSYYVLGFDAAGEIMVTTRSNLPS